MATAISLIIWITLGFICMKMAEVRGRNKILGFIAGLFLGLIAVIYYLIVGDTREKRLASQGQVTGSDTVEAEEEMRRYCPECGEMFFTGARFCKHCGSKIEEV